MKCTETIHITPIYPKFKHTKSKEKNDRVHHTRFLSAFPNAH